MEILCKNCGKSFKVANWQIKKGTKYCSHECYWEDKRGGKKKEEKVCIECGEKFLQETWESKRKFCSHECYWKNKKKLKDIDCLNCGKTFEPYNLKTKFCSKKCSGEYIRKQNNKICIQCGKEYHPLIKTSQYCSRECYWNYRRENKGVIIQTNQGDFRTKLICNNCGKEYLEHKYRLKVSKFCSMKCHFESKRLKKKCPTCEKYFEVPNHLAHRIFCSKDCVDFTNKSKKENDFYKFVNNIINVEQNKKVIYDKVYFPDLMNEENKIIIEFFGDYWHCNPNFYEDEYYNSKTRKHAHEMWSDDQLRLEKLEGLGYDVNIIWENEWETDLELVKTKILKIKDKYEIRKN